jgi:SAM-dependent methyltransferase
MDDLEFTGERVVPAKMGEYDMTLLEHLARYDFAVEHQKGSVLDAACGSGYGSKMLSNAEGIDLSAEAVAYAQSIYGIKASCFDLENGLPAGCWDTIVSFETIEHLGNPHLFLSHASSKSLQFIFSIPLNNPSQFHKVVYTLGQAQDLIYQYFNKVEWYEQTFTEIKKLQSENPVFLVGIASVAKKALDGAFCCAKIK